MEDRGRLTKWSGKSARFVDFSGQKLDTIITGHLTQEQVNAYQQYFRIEEISHTLRKAVASGTSITHVLLSHNVENFRRDPSPPPQYDNAGNRTNTRDQRIRSLLEKERHTLVELAATSIKHYDPPVDYTKPAKTSEKLYIPIKDYPDINFVGLLLGPRGNTLRQLQEDSGAKLAIRGKGSVKDGKLMDSTGQLSLEDNLHVVITADTTAKILKAIKLTNEVLEKAISSPVGQNDLKRDQLRELAVLNGTLRETKPYVAPELFNAQRRLQTRDITQIVCRVCGNVGHYSRDCKMRNEHNSMDSYSPGSGNSNGQAAAGHSHIPHNRPPVEDVPPWKRARTEQTLNQATPPWISQPNPGNHYASLAYTLGHTGHQAYGSLAYSLNYGRPDLSQQYPQRANHYLPPQIPPIPGHNHSTGNGYYKQPFSSNIPAQGLAVPSPSLASAHIRHTERAPLGPPPTLGNIARASMEVRPPPPPPPPAGVVLSAPPAAPAQGFSLRPPPPPPPPKSGPLDASGPKPPPPPPPLG